MAFILSDLPYYRIPEHPKGCTPHSILLRVIDGLGFRYYWATEGLEDSEYEFRPGSDCRNMKELLQHIHDQVISIYASLGGKKSTPSLDLTPCEIRKSTLQTIYESRKKLEKMGSVKLVNCTIYSSFYDKEFPIWNIINGPICDVLTHIGQLVSWRRLAGNPIHGANVFLGEPPILDISE